MADSQLMAGLVAQAWQITLLILAVAVLNCWLGKSRPHLAHALWVVVLVKCVTPPMWSSPSGVFCWLQPPCEVAQQRSIAVVQNPREASPETECLTERGQVFKFHFWDHERHQTWTGAQTPDVRQSPFVAPKMKFEYLTPARDELVAEVWPSRPATAAGWPNALFGLWGLASLGVIGVATGRWHRCWRIVRNAPLRECPELSEQMALLAKQLRLRRRVRLIVTESRLGPAVIGLFRTTVLLPTLIVDRLLANQSSLLGSQSDVRSSRRMAALGRPCLTTKRCGTAEGGHPTSPLVAIFAHELLHIRRGDLWVGLLQTLAQAVWWCHPLVWWVNRLTTREAERCCDEEVLAELGCDPAAYARVLVDVLELKRELKPVPVFPGVRPVEVTSQRLERIMQLGQGCRRRTPWWCWLIAALAAAASWPGAAFVVTAEDAKDSKPAHQVEVVPEHKSVASNAELDTASTVIYDIADIVSTLDVSEKEMKVQFENLVRSVRRGSGATAQWHDQTLIVRANGACHREVRMFLEMIRGVQKSGLASPLQVMKSLSEFGNEPFMFCMRLIGGPEAELIASNQVIAKKLCEDQPGFLVLTRPDADEFLREVQKSVKFILNWNSSANNGALAAVADTSALRELYKQFDLPFSISPDCHWKIDAFPMLVNETTVLLRLNCQCGPLAAHDVKIGEQLPSWKFRDSSPPLFGEASYPGHSDFRRRPNAGLPRFEVVTSERRATDRTAHSPSRAR